MKPYKMIWILLFLVALLYLPFLGNAFVSDDIPGLVAAAPAWTWVSSTGWPNYVHLSVFFQNVLYHVFGLVPWPFRLLNILFHAGSVVLVFVIVKKLVGEKTARVAALLFAVHPLATEAVVWISGGNYAQHTVFLLVSLWLYMKRTIRTYIGALVFFLLCLATSEKTIALFLIFVAFEWFFGDLPKNWKRVIPFLGMSMIFLVFYGLKIGERTESLTALSYLSHSGLTNPLVQLPVAVSSYVELFLWPVHLTFYHAAFNFPWWNFSIRAAVAILFAAGLVYTLVKRNPIGFWLSWVLIGLAPTLTPFKIAWIVAERYVYFSLIGFSIIAAALFTRIVSVKKYRRITMCVGLIVLVALCSRTMVRSSEWKTEDILSVATLRESPEDPKSWNNVGEMYAQRGEYDKSLDAYTRAISINPNFADAFNNIGDLYGMMQKYDEAQPYFEKALSINPKLWQSYAGLAQIAAKKQNYQQALTFILLAQAINPADAGLQKMADELKRVMLSQ